MTFPHTMTAVEIREPGGPEVLVAVQRPVPKPGLGEILIRVAAAGVNRPDVMQRKGRYPPPPGASDIPGLEVSGKVVAVGAAVELFAPGDDVCALIPGGGYAEFAVAHATNTLPVPAGVSLAEAAALPEALFTVWVNVVDRGKLQPGETLLVHGGSSGVGTLAIQVAKALGAIVLVTCGSDKKCQACVALGASAAINYRTADFVAVGKAETDGRGVDVILDMVGGDYVARNYALAAEGGRILQIAAQESVTAKIDLRPLMAKRLIHTGSTLRARSVAFKADVAAALQDRIWPLIAAGKIAPVIDSTFPLAEAAAAHRRIEEPDHIGKVVLLVR